MSDTKQFFKVENENGEIKDAELLNIFSKDDIEYAVYSIDNGDDTSNLYASRIIINENGETRLEDLKDNNEKIEIIKIIKDLLNQ